ncbi:DMT family transporter [Thermoleophilum album]|uniref:Transporter family-2 protein n=1 Tax=Thermoleophilum album TaxID=29539 RepID=A0A1H6FVK4_THEAL|nr:DMT family transporter [Thermoleophilum album]SEH14023.1 transporter family-2 protein [Thermoleophilum album]
MSRLLAVLATVLAGGLVGMQAPINSVLGKRIGTLAAASVSFAVGLAALAALTVLIGGGFGRLGEIRGLPWYYLIGGLLGAVYVTCVLLSVRTIGAGGVAAATIVGQLTMSVLLDRFGLLGLPQRPLDITRLAGVALLVAGTALVVRG